MSYKYFTVLTDVGKQKLAEAIANETALDFTEMAVGDSNGTSYEPTSDMTALKHVTYRAAIGSMKINAEDKNIMEFEFVVPASVGGFYIREAGLYSSDGTLIAISRLPEQYKADMAEGAGSSMTVRILVAISSDAQIYITVPASITYATQTYVVEEFKKHKADSNPHEQYVLNDTYSAKIDELEEDINSKAASNHNHDSTYLKKTDASNTYATKEALNTGLAGKAATNHNHDSAYLKKTDASSTYATKSELNTGLAGKAATNHSHSNYMSSTPASLEFKPSSSANNGGFLDFHWNGSSSDYTSRIIEADSGAITIFAAQGLYLNGKRVALDKDVINKMPKVSKTSGVGHLQQVVGQGVPVTYRLPSDGTYFYFLTCTNDYNNYSAMDNITGIDEGGTEILPASMNKKTFGGFIWRIQ